MQGKEGAGSHREGQGRGQGAGQIANFGQVHPTQVAGGCPLPAPFLGGPNHDQDGVYRCYSPHGCGKAGKRIGSLCAIEVEGLKRRPPTQVGGLSLEFRA